MMSHNFLLLFPVTFTVAILLICGLREADSQIHSGRLKLMKNALDWMTFRKDGKLASATEREQLFLSHFRDRYNNSRYYRTFVIAFLEGVVPKLTLQENDPCDPTYTFKYKDRWNSSVGYGYQVVFNFESYDRRKMSDYYCDYRQGLICNPSTKKCECPEGSSMQPIESGSAVRRCLLAENEICALIDLAHGRDPAHLELARNLLHLALNLEKPLSCKMGTQCRFKPTDLVSPRCYDVSSGPWAPPFTDAAGATLNDLELKFGDECTIGLYASSGMCFLPLSGNSLTYGRYICYNYGPPRSMRSTNARNRTGFCGPAFGRYGIIGKIRREFDEFKVYYPIFTPYVYPRTVPLRGKELEDFMITFVDAAHKLDPSKNDVQTHSAGGPCSMQKTKDFEDVWSYFSSLDEEPPVGQDYVPAATKALVEANLQKFVDLTDLTTRPGKICKVYYQITRWAYDGYNLVEVPHPSVKCVRGATDSSGNDGKCVEPGTLDTLLYARNFLEFLDVERGFRRFLTDNEYEVSALRHDILRVFPEDHETLRCTPQDLPCPAGRVCYDDYSDIRRMYNRSSCDFLEQFCHESRVDLEYGKCEEKQLHKRGLQDFEELIDYSTIGRGEACDYDMELKIRQWIKPPGPYEKPQPKEYNKYEFLAMLRDKKKSGGFLCDRTKLLVCTEAGVCECYKWKIPNVGPRPPIMEPRKVTVEGKQYESDHCYQASEGCRQLADFQALTTAEMQKVLIHYYGETDGKCEGGNLCVYFYPAGPGGSCTTDNTGKTGYEGVEPTTTTTPRITTTKKGVTAPPGTSSETTPEPESARAPEALGGKLLTIGLSLIVKGMLQVELVSFAGY